MPIAEPTATYGNLRQKRNQSMSVVEESESVSKSVTSGSHSESVSSLIGTTQQGKVQPPRQYFSRQTRRYRRRERGCSWGPRGRDAAGRGQEWSLSFFKCQMRSNVNKLSRLLISYCGSARCRNDAAHMEPMGTYGRTCRSGGMKTSCIVATSWQQAGNYKLATSWQQAGSTPATSTQ